MHRSERLPRLLPSLYDRHAQEAGMEIYDRLLCPATDRLAGLSVHQDGE